MDGCPQGRQIDQVGCLDPNPTLWKSCGDLFRSGSATMQKTGQQQRLSGWRWSHLPWPSGRWPDDVIRHYTRNSSKFIKFNTKNQIYSNLMWKNCVRIVFLFRRKAGNLIISACPTEAMIVTMPPQWQVHLECPSTCAHKPRVWITSVREPNSGVVKCPIWYDLN